MLSTVFLTKLHMCNNLSSIYIWLRFPLIVGSQDKAFRVQGDFNSHLLLRPVSVGQNGLESPLILSLFVAFYDLQRIQW